MYLKGSRDILFTAGIRAGLTAPGYCFNGCTKIGELHIIKEAPAIQVMILAAFKSETVLNRSSINITSVLCDVADAYGLQT